MQFAFNFGFARGTITSGGNPLPGVQVDFVTSNPQQGGTSAGNGYYVAGAIVDTNTRYQQYTMRAQRFAYLTYTDTITLRLADTVTRNIVMQALDLVLTKSSITFPTTPVYGTKRDSLVARNQRGTSLVLSSLTATNADFAVSPTSVTIPAGDSVKILVTYTPTLEGPDTGRVIILSNSTYTPRADVILSGTGIGAPRFLARVDSVSKVLEGGVRDSVVFHMRNAGTTSGNFFARAIMYPRVGAAKPIYVPVSMRRLDFGEMETSVMVRRVLLVSDNPGLVTDAYDAEKGSEVGTHDGIEGVSSSLIYRALVEGGYVVDSVSFAAHDPSVYPTYDLVVWVAGINSTSPVFNDAAKRAALVSRVNMGGKVWVEGGEVGYHYRKSGTTTDLDPPFRRSVLRDSLWVSDVSSSNLVLTQTNHPIFTVPNIITSPVTFSSTSIYARDAMRLQPGDPNAQKLAGWSVHTVQGPDTAGIIVSQVSGIPTTVFTAFAWSAIGDTMVAKRLAQNIAAWLVGLSAPWLTANPNMGTLAIGDSVRLVAGFDATDPTIYGDPGNYYGRIEVTATNSALADTLKIPARMFVIPPGGARLTVSPDSLNFGDVEIGQGRTLSVLVRNIGAASLNVTGISMTNTNFAAAPMSFTLASLDTQRVNVTFTAPSPGATHTGMMNFISNDPMAANVRLRGRSIGIPHVAVAPDSFAFVVPRGDSTTGTIIISNTGLGELSYSSRVQGGFVGSATDDIGSTQYNLATTSQLMRGGVVSPTSPAMLVEIRSWLNITTPVELRFVVYENTAATGTFTKIFEVSVSNAGPGTQWYVSGPVNLTMQPGKFYAIGVDWAGALTYYWQVSSSVPVPISFGTITGGFAQSVYPPPATISQGALTSLYYSQIVTASAQWMSVMSGGSGTIAYGDSARLLFRARTSQLPLGTARAAVEVLSNDPGVPLVNVPVRVDVITGIGNSRGIPDRFALDQNYPNPFNPSTVIRYALPTEANVTLRMYNVLGQEVATLVNETEKAAYYEIRWDGKNRVGASISTGMYFVRIDAVPIDGSAAFSQVRKMLMIK
jgi:hypothetical protein